MLHPALHADDSEANIIDAFDDEKCSGIKLPCERLCDSE